MRIRWLGHDLRAEAEIISDCDLTLARAHAIAEEAHHRLLHDVPRLAVAIIHSNLATTTVGSTTVAVAGRLRQLVDRWGGRAWRACCNAVP